MMETTPDPALDLTIDARRPGTPDEPFTSSEAPSAFCCRGGKIAKSKAGMTGDTHGLLLTRLRAAAAILLGAFSVFLLWSFLAPADYAAVKSLWGLQLGAIAVLAITLGGLFKYPRASITVLRSAEFLIFATPAAYFLLMDGTVLAASASISGYSRSIAASWLILMMIYALMIPNTWRRAAIVLGPYVLAPVTLLSIPARLLILITA